MPAPPPTPQCCSIEMRPQERPEADAASTFHPLHPGLMLNGAVFLSELSGPSATPRGEMTAPSSPQLQGRTQGRGRTHSVLRLSWGGALGEHTALAGGVWPGAVGGCAAPLLLQAGQKHPMGGACWGHHRWMGETVHQKNWGLCSVDGPCLPGLRFTRVGGSGHRRPGADAAWSSGAQWALALASTAAFDLHAVHQCIPGTRRHHQGPCTFLRKTVGDAGLPGTEGPT